MTSTIDATPATHTVTRTYDDYRALFAGHRMPFAYVDLDLLDANISQALKRAGAKHIRLASKSIRSVALLRHIFAADARFQGIMCYTAREAAWLASQGFDDLLLGYPTWHAADVAAVAEQVRAGKRITFMVDSLEQVAHLAELAQRFGVRHSVCIEVDCSIDVPGLHFGVWRSPLRTPAAVRPIAERIL
ncbi:MAG: alanine racemase, partial [Ktedonobacterales bacterium]|nr:alanine racemase [Ktedonobacterales bacterium]